MKKNSQIQDPEILTEKDSDSGYNLVTGGNQK